MPESVIKYSDLIGEDDTFRVIFDNIEKLKKELVELTKIVKKDLDIVNPNDPKKVQELTKEVERLTKMKKMLENEEKTAIKTKKKLNDLTQEELIQREKEKIANRERVQIAKQQAILTNKQSGEIEKLRAKLSLTTLEWKKLTKNELENTAKGQNLIRTKRRLTDQLKRLEKQTGDTRRNVGNYSESLGKLGRLSARIFIGRSLFDGLRRIGSAFSSLIEQNRETNAEIGKLDNSIKGFGSAISGVGTRILSFVAKPLALLLDGLSSALSLFADPKPFKEFSATSEQLKDETSKLNDEFIKEKTAVTDLFISLQNTNKGSKERNDLINQINKQYGQYLPKLLTEKSSLQEIEQAQRLVNQELTRNFRIKIQNATQTDVLTNKIKFQNAEFEKFRKIGEQLGVTVDETLGFAFGQLLDDFSKTGTEGNSAAKSLTDYAFNVSKTADEIRKTNPELADLVETFKEISLQQGRQSTNYENLVDDINAAARTSENYNKQIDKTQKITQKLTEGQRQQNKVLKDNKKEIVDNTDAIESNNQKRLKAIISLQQQFEKLQIENIQDAEEKAIQLENKRFQAEQQTRLENLQKFQDSLDEKQKLIIEQFGKESDELKEFQIERNQEIADLIKVSDDLEIEQIKRHEQNKLDIRKDFAEKRKIQEEKDEKERLKQLEKSFNEEVDLYLENNEEIDKQEEEQLKKDSARIEKQLKKAEKTKQFFKDLFSTASKVGDAIVKQFEKQSDAAAKLVEEQSDAVERQRERAEQGLSNTLKFEQEELARRESERLQAEQRQKQAAKILTLFNLVSAYAQSGDKNALQRGLVDFGILTSLESLFTGFESGGYTGTDSSNSQVKGVVHANEYVVTAKDTKRFGLIGKTGEQFGEAMSDYFSEQSPIFKNNFIEQSKKFNDSIKQPIFNDFSQMNTELREIRKELKNQQKNEFDVLRMTDYFIEISNKVTNKKMTTVQKVKKRL